jgi:hypothetical protein
MVWVHLFSNRSFRCEEQYIMRHVFPIAVVVCLALAVRGASGADDAADAQAVIDQAVTAMGGADNLAKYKAATWKETGTYYGMGDGIPFTGMYSVQLPKQMRMEIKDVFTIVINGDEGWTKDMSGEVKDMPKEQLEEHRESNYSSHLIHDLSVLKDKAYHVSAPKADKVSDRPAVTITVSHKGHRDITLTFDKETHLLIKSTRVAKSVEQGNQDTKQEALLSEYKEVQGVKMPTKIVIQRDGKPYVEATAEDIKLLEKLDDQTFAKP